MDATTQAGTHTGRTDAAISTGHASDAPANKRWRSPVRDHWPLLLVLALFVPMAIAYNLVTPIGESVDESSHLDYVVYLHQAKQLPVLTPEIDTGIHQAGHPPLYYLLGAILTAGMDVQKPTYVLNPDFSFNWDRPTPPPPNIYVHVQDPPFPWDGRPDLRAAHVMRLASLLSAILTLCATYALARALFPRERHIAGAATAVVAFVPTYTFFGGMFNNDALLNAWVACALVLCVRVLQGHVARRDLVVLGVVLGLGLMTKLTALTMLPVAALAVGLAAWRAGDRRLLVRAAFEIGVPVALIAGWWVIRNIALYGIDDPLGWRIFSARAPELLRRQPLASDLPTYFRFQFVSFWGAFGWANIRLPDVAYRAFAVACLAALVGLTGFVVRRARSLDATTRWGLVLLATTIVVGYAFVFRLVFTFNLSVAQGRYVHFLLPALAVFLVFGLTQLVSPRARAAIASVAAAALFAVSLYALVAIVPAAYATPPAVSADRIARIQHRLDLDVVDRARLVGYDLDRNRVRPGDTISVTLYWDAQSTNWQPFPRTNDSFWIFLQAIDASGEVVARMDTTPFSGRHPVLAWRPGEVIAETFHLPVAASAVPGGGAILVGMFVEGHSDRRLPIARGGHSIGDAARLEPLVIRPATDVHFDPGLGSPRDDRFDDPAGIRLIGAGLATDTVRPGEAVTVTLYWTAERAPEVDYTCFVHVAGADGAPVATGDGLPQSGRYPTSLWEAGETVPDAHVLTIPADIAPGRYEIGIGLYVPATGVRVPALRSSGERWEGDEVVIGTLVVAPGAGRS
jgi:4-amino-4-deoxy-L-arabinose transferase-like glycosyltransferase